jgi:hypothetical protein
MGLRALDAERRSLETLMDECRMKQYKAIMVTYTVVCGIYVQLIEYTGGQHFIYGYVRLIGLIFQGSIFCIWLSAEFTYRL